MAQITLFLTRGMPIPSDLSDFPLANSRRDVDVITG
jgi:hypothetical protein